MVESWLGYSEKNGFFKITDVNGLTGNEKVFPAAFKDTISRLKKAKKRIWVFGQMPWAPVDPRQFAVVKVFGGSVPNKFQLMDIKKN
jgi:hypothetical protein